MVVNLVFLAVGRLDRIQRPPKHLRITGPNNGFRLMQVNDLIELLEYCDPTAIVSVGIATRDGDIFACPNVRFLSHEGVAFLIVDDLPEIGEFASKLPGIKSSEISLSEYDCPQVFGKHLVYIKRQAPLAD